jgi:hypothetical protein
MPSHFANLFHYALGIILHPIRTLHEFSIEPKKRLYSLLIVIIFAFLYSVGALTAYLKHHLPYGWEPFIKIPINQFFLWESIYLIPITIATWILLAGCVQLVSKLFQGTGSFEDTFALLGLPFFVLIPGMFIPDFIMEFLPSNLVKYPLFWNTINPARLMAGSIWPIIIHILAVKEVQKISFLQACAVIIISYIPYGVVLMTYVH